MRILQTALTMLLGLGMASPAWSVMIGGVEVGSIDTIVDVTSDLNALGPCGKGNSSNPDREECWAENALGGTTDLTLTGIDDTVSVIYGGSLAAFALTSCPGHYIVKNSTTWVLMENLADAGWGVLNTADPLLGGYRLNLGGSSQLTISHVTHFDGGNSNGVPEPNTLALVGLGLVGIGFARRKRQQRI